MLNKILLNPWIYFLLVLGFTACEGNHSDEPAPDTTLLPSAATANFSTNIQLVDVKQTIVFKNESVNATRYTWYFGDGDSSSSVNTGHKYLYPGKYNAILKAFDSQGIPSIKTMQVAVGERYITSLEINKLKFTDPAGNQWDYGTGPDVWLGYIRMSQVNFMPFYRVKNNLNAGLIPYTHIFEADPFTDQDYKFVLSELDSTSATTSTSQEMTSWIANPAKIAQWDSVSNTGYVELKNSDYEIRFNLKLKLK